MNSFYSLMQSGFIEAELVSDGAAAAVTDEAGENAFELYELCERIRRVQRYSYQRPFAEAYRLTEDFCGWRTGANGANVSPRSVIITDEKCLLAEKYSGKHLYRGFSRQQRLRRQRSFRDKTRKV